MSASRKEFFARLAKIMEEDPTVITADKSFRDFRSWDSLAVISFVALLDEHYNIIVDAEKLSEAKTFDDLAVLAGV